MRCILFAGASLLASCGSTHDDSVTQSSRAAVCLDIARQYAAALSDAVICDPTVTNSCSAQRPFEVYLQTDSHELVLQGLCQCPAGGPVHVNPARTARLDELLSRFASEGCVMGNCPCPSPLRPGDPPPSCHPTTSGTGTCS
jgi:hypothetical protein